MPEAPPSDPPAEAWPESPSAESSPFIHAPDHISFGVEIQY